jgi:hypothetical protein
MQLGSQTVLWQLRKPHTAKRKNPEQIQIKLNHNKVKHKKG